MNPANFHKILVANRGEIALRIIRAIRQLDKLAVVVHSDFDRDLPFVTEADEAYSLGSGDLSQTYLNVTKIMEVAKIAQVDAIHPGYGFLAESPQFVETCRREHITFIGPDPEVMELMGHKSNAREKAKEMGIPVLEGVTGDLETLIRERDSLPYPLLVKPAAGGGGKGMRIVHSAAAFESEAREASREALNYFGSAALYVERYLENPRHIEVQIIADHFGHAAHLFERECSLQRRYQKIIEEAPSGFLSPGIREKITGEAIRLVRGINYTNAGTIEFLMEASGHFYFLEMNTRIQVEHPVTEMITGIDLVREQIRIAEGKPLSFSQEDLVMKGHAIEARIYAEDPQKEFMPSTGRIETFEVPQFEGTRSDSGFRKGNLVEPYYDPMLAKIIASGENRELARKKLIGALREVRITGLRTNRDFLIGLLRSPEFEENRIHTRFVDQNLEALLETIQRDRGERDMDSLLSAATLIALQTNHELGSQSRNPWHSIGHWRILPEITLMADHKEYLIRYELLKGRLSMRLHLENRLLQVSQERREGNNYWIRIDNQVLKVWGITDRSEILLDLDGYLFRFRRMDILDRRYIRSSGKTTGKAKGAISAPLNGRIVQINVQEGEQVNEGDPLLVIESMKMENKILASQTARVKKIGVTVGEQVRANQLIITLDNL
jgi:3-methylcrotonyl-CoA carboxylase alpha subunit